MLALLLVLAMGQPTPFERLQALGGFTVTLNGPSLATLLAQTECVYWEWAAGERRGDEWATRVGSGHSGNLLTIVTPAGTLDLPHGSLRLYLPPSITRQFTRSARNAAPMELRHLLDDMDPLSVSEYLLQSGVTYYARVEVESGMLPPRDGNAPERRRTLVLAISDRPFVDGKAQRPLTPSFIGFAR
jgi:hypothetical protein